jgi:hypothetical protein
MKKFILRVLLLTLLWQVSSPSAADTPDNATGEMFSQPLNWQYVASNIP